MHHAESAPVPEDAKYYVLGSLQQVISNELKGQVKIQLGPIQGMAKDAIEHISLVATVHRRRESYHII